MTPADHPATGAEWFSGIGTPKSPGTAIFALTGKINNTGLIEVPMGIPLGEIIFDIGGGIPKGKQFKAVQTGGPLGGCLPASALNTPVDFDSLTAGRRHDGLRRHDRRRRRHLHGRVRQVLPAPSPRPSRAASACPAASAASACWRS